MDGSPPVIGACLPVDLIPVYRDWLFDMDRDLEIQSFTRPDVLEGDWRSLAEEAVRQLDGFDGRIGIHGPFYGLDLGSADPEIRSVVTRRIKQAVEICAVLGARQMILHSPFNRTHHNNFPVAPAWRRGVIEALTETLAPAARMAADEGVMLCLENIDDCDPGLRVAFIEEFGAAELGVSVDTGHAHLAHCLSGAPSVDHFIRAAGARLAHVHLQDLDGYADCHWAPGDGALLWPPIFRAIEESGAEPHLVLELRDHGSIPRAMTYLEGEGLAR